MSDVQTIRPAVSAPPHKLLRVAVKSAIQVVRYWWVIAIALTISLVSGVLLSKLTSETTWSVEAGLVYGRLPIDGSAERLYIPPDLRTVTSMLKSASVLDRAIEEGKLNYSAHGLASSLVVDEPRGTQKIGLTIVTSDVDDGMHVLDSVIKAFQEHVAGMRRSLISNNLSDLQTSLARNEARMTETRSRLTEFSVAHQVNDLDAEVQSLVANVSSMDYQLSSQRIEEQSLRVQRQSVQQQLDQQKQQEELEKEGEKEAEAAEESLADNRRRQDRLNELISEERRLNEIRAKLDAKQSEYNRKIVLYEKNYLSKNDFESIRAEVESLKSQILEGNKIDEWKTELERIDKMVVPKAKSRRIGSPIIHQTMFKLVELDLHVLASQESQRQLSMVIADDRRRLSELELFKTEQAGLLAEVKSASDERDSINNQISSLQAVHDMGPGEFSIAQTPSSNMRPPTSNRKKLFVLIFGGISVMLLSPVALLAIATATRPSLLEFTEEVGLATLSPRKSLMEVLRESTQEEIEREQSSWCRHIALRLQQLLPQPGAVFTFLPCSVTPREADTTLLIRIAETLARRDETVLVVSMPGNAPAVDESKDDTSPERQRTYGHLEKLGLFDFVNDSEVSFELIVREISDRVHLVAGGKYDPERLLAKRMTDFFEHARKSYSMVVLLGPFLGEQTNVEMIARHSDGVLLLHDRSDGLTNDMQRTIESLSELQAPVLGVATRTGVYRRPRIRFSFGLKSNRKPPASQTSRSNNNAAETIQHPSLSATPEKAKSTR